jgi:hypothetical protein
VVKNLDLPKEFRLFGADTQYEAAPLAEALSDQLGRDTGNTLTVWVSGSPADWELGSWSLAPVLERWGARGRVIRLAIDEEAVRQADPVTRRDLVLWSQRARVQLVSRAVGDEGTRLASVLGPRAALMWASSSKAAHSIGAEWAAVSEAPVVRGAASAEPELRPLIPSELLNERQREHIFEIGAELNGPVENFGERFKAHLRGRSASLARMFSSPCLELRYSDRYLYSPLTVRLLTEIVRAFADRNTKVVVQTMAARFGPPPRNAKWLHKDWS